MPLASDIEAKDGKWFTRRILPYRTQDNRVAGIVITFTDITQQRKDKLAVTAAQMESERANMGKSRFLAAASHDLRQPLQTLTLLNSLLVKVAEGEKAQSLLKRMDETTNAMGSILDTLLDINQLDAGMMNPVMENFAINTLLQKLSKEFADIAKARGLSLRMVPCSLYVRTDPKILEQMIRNLLSNALKYTKKGGVLLGCRRHKNSLSIEIWDSGLGIAKAELAAIFDEYHQVDNAARERSRGLGLGLTIVQRLADLLGHRIAVRSSHGKGSVFAIITEICNPPTHVLDIPAEITLPHDATAAARLTGNILVIDDDPDIRQLLAMFLQAEGHHAAAADSGEAALALVTTGAITPDLVIIDYNLPDCINGLQIVAQLQAMLQKKLAVIVCTGDISTGTLQNIALHNYVRMSKPMRLSEMNDVIQRLLSTQQATATPKPPVISHHAPPSKQTIFIIDDDSEIRSALQSIFETNGQKVETYADSESFINAGLGHENACLLVDAYLPGMSGLELLHKLAAEKSSMPAIMITGRGDIKMAVEAIKAGAFDFIEKPISAEDLALCVNRAFAQSKDLGAMRAKYSLAAEQIALLTPRQLQIMERVLSGQANKNIAMDLGISQRTVENHRAAIMEKTKTKSLPALARLAMLAAENSSSA
jgi:two-component system CheB/CheR fusion protein